MECFAGEGDGAGQGQEARAGVQDGSAMQVEIFDQEAVEPPISDLIQSSDIDSDI